jgi:hypothetical protein
VLVGLEAVQTYGIPLAEERVLKRLSNGVKGDLKEERGR